MKRSRDRPSPQPAPAARGRASSGKPVIGQGESVKRFADRWHRERPDLDFEWMRVAVYIHEIEQAFRGDLARAVIPELGGGLADFDVISHLRAVGAPYAMRPTDLFRLLSVTSGAVTGRIDRLVGLGWVTRDASQTDRRAALIRLTKKGLAASNWLADYGANTSVIARALKEMPRAQRRALASSLETFYGALEQAREKAPSKRIGHP